MDRTDLAIFSHLVSDALGSDEAIGREVGLTGKAVRARRQRMEAAGVLTAYGIHPAAAILGRHALTWRFAGAGPTDLPVSRLNEIDDLAYVMRFRPNLYLAVRFTKEADAPNDPRLSKILGPPISEEADRIPSVPAVEAGELSRADWNVLEALVENPRQPYSIKAKRARLSARTFRIRQSKLEAARAILCVMILNLEREAGMATYGIWLKVDDSFDPHAVELPRLWDRPHWTEHPRGVYLLGSAENYFEAREVELRLRSLPGVLGADPLIPAGGYFARERFLEWIQAARDLWFPSPRR
ncbi:MAG TPA: AsnC family transcriptional regulator [Thermoplasmata archaeon]|nr:AsnC family transcriptional regulator [Thermoplasmata archaeon]